MMLGIILKGVNALYFRKFLDFFFEFLPQVVFMLSTFGYMVFCIVIKWLTIWPDPSKAPSIITLFINFVTKVDEPLYHSAGFQLTVQRTLALSAVICIPLMLFFKPLLLQFSKPSPKHSYRKISQRELYANYSEIFDADTSHNLMTSFSDDNDENKHEDHDTSELFVHQSIETIEFILGSISNTASYLRLWALSLAHTQLAKVFLDMLVKPYFMGNHFFLIDAILIMFGFTFFFIVTLAVLMIMDVMECFLHALRLHWVEFQNKFFKGEGDRFIRFDLTELILNKED